MPDSAFVRRKTSPGYTSLKAEKNLCSEPGACPVLSLPLFHHINGKDQQCFKQLATVHTYCRENILFYQGNRPLGLYFICGGRVKITKEDRGGRSQIVRIVLAPNILGDRAFFAEQPYACTGVAMDKSQICFLETRHFWKIFGKNVEILRFLTQRFAHGLGCAEEHMNCIAACTVMARMATYLLKSWNHSACSQVLQDKFVLTESRTELAQLLGTTPEAVSRVLSKLCSKGLIAVQGRHMRVLDKDRLSLLTCLHNSVA